MKNISRGSGGVDGVLRDMGGGPGNRGSEVDEFAVREDLRSWVVVN